MNKKPVACCALKIKQNKIIYIYMYIDIKWNTKSAVTWQTVHEHIVADAFCSKSSTSALLVHEQQASQKRCLLNRHSTACGYKNGIYMNTNRMCKAFNY